MGNVLQFAEIAHARVHYNYLNLHMLVDWKLQLLKQTIYFTGKKLQERQKGFYLFLKYVHHVICENEIRRLRCIMCLERVILCSV